MNTAEILEALQHLTHEEKLEVIEVASRLLRQELITSKTLSLAAAAVVMRPFYEPGSELAQLTDQDTEDFYEYADYT